MNRLMLLPALFAAVVLAACDYPAEVSSPLSGPGPAPYDERLVGTWYVIGGGDETGVATLTAAPGDEGTLQVTGVYVVADEGDEPDDNEVEFAWMNWTAHASELDGKTYFNARLIDSMSLGKETGEPPEFHESNIFASHPERGYWIIRPEIDEAGLLFLNVLWENDLEVEPRVVDCGEGCSFKLLELSPEDLAAAIRAAPPEKVFSTRLGPFARIEGTYPAEWDG